MQQSVPARLVLEDGGILEGVSFGSRSSAAGEVVFTTGMAGYPQTLSDPSYRGQIIVSTYPLVGNYGVPVDPRSYAAFLDERGVPVALESERVQAAGLVVAEPCERPSHRASGARLSDWLEAQGVPGIAGIDTRALTARLRERGTMRGAILVGDDEVASIDGRGPVHAVSEVSPRSVRVYEGKGPRVALVDCGAKANILRCLLGLGASVVRVPWDHDLSGLAYDGVLFSNGPGDPKDCARTIATARRVLKAGKPAFGICLGNQILALAAGADTYRLPYGHRSLNQPCVEEGTGRCRVTSQNHGYAVDEKTLPRGWEVWFRNANDGSVEGIKAKGAPFSAVQFHPEGCPGPLDSEGLLADFVALAAEASA